MTPRSGYDPRERPQQTGAKNRKADGGARRTRPLQARDDKMKRATEIRPGPKRLACLALALAALSGCEDVLTTADKPEEKSNATELFPQASTSAQRDVEAPDVFELTEAGLWDGRPSLGGIWVAHPDVTQPERVVIKNAANNKSVTGALFRRERNLPGPALQVSSAAAEQLGMLAGAPAKINVVALRREAIVETPPEPEPEVVAEEVEAAPEPDAESQDTEIASADAAEAAVETEKPAKRKWWQRKKPAAAAAGAAGVAAVASDTTEAATDTAAEVTEEAVEAAAETAVEAAPSPALTDAPVAAPAEKPAKRKWWQRKDPNEITETTLDPIEGAAAAIEASEATPAAAAAPVSSALSKPFVQVGTFGVEANADSAAAKIRRNGMAADVRELKTEDNTVWRVLVGPAATRAERKAIQNDVKDLGFTDAFTVSN